RRLGEQGDGRRGSMGRSRTPAGPDLPNGLFDTAAVAADDVWAVGEQGFPERALALHWQGSTWSAVSTPCGAPLKGVAAISASDVWAVGENTTCHFDGVRWTVVPGPQPRPGF